MSYELEKFSSQLEGFVKATEHAMTNTLREIVVEVGIGVIKFSPVRTGRFKGNWQMTVGTPSTHSSSGTDPSGEATIAELKVMAATLNPGEVAYIVNNLTYAYNVEVMGWEVTPPYMPVQRTLSEFTALVTEAIDRNKVNK